MKKWMILLSAMVVLLCLNLSVSAEEAIYKSDFSKGLLLYDWEEIMGEGGSSVENVMALEMGTRTLIKDLTFTEGTIEARVVADEIYTHDHWIGILFATQPDDYNKGMMVFVRGPRYPLPERIFIHDWVGGTLFQGEPTEEMGLFDNLFTLKVVVEGGKVSVFINEIPAGEAEIPEAYADGGRVGIAVNNLRAYVVYFKVTE